MVSAEYRPLAGYQPRAEEQAQYVNWHKTDLRFATRLSGANPAPLGEHRTGFCNRRAADFSRASVAGTQSNAAGTLQV